MSMYMKKYTIFFTYSCQLYYQSNASTMSEELIFIFYTGERSVPTREASSRFPGYSYYSPR